MEKYQLQTPSRKLNTPKFSLQKIVILSYKPFFLVFRTLIGSVRPQSFIPWEDNIDTTNYVSNKNDVKKIKEDIILLFKNNYIVNKFIYNYIDSILLKYKTRKSFIDTLN